MADTDVQVTFGADTAALTAGTNIAKSEVDRLVQAIALLQKTVGAAARATTSELTAAITGMGSQASSQAPRVRAMAQEVERLSTAGHAGHGTIFGMQSGVFLELRALLDEALSGRMRNFEGSFARLLGMLGPAIGGFVSANPLIAAFGAAAVVATGSIVGLGLAINSANNAMKSIELDAATNQFLIGDEAANKLRDSIKQLANVGNSEAEEIYKPFAKLGPVSEIVAQMAAVFLPALAGSEKKVGEVAGELAKRLEDLGGAGRKFVQDSRSATEEQKKQYDAFVATGDKAHAYAMILDLTGASVRKVGEDHAIAKASVIDAADALNREALSGGDLTASENNLGQAVAETTAKIDAQTAQLDALRAGLLNAKFAADQLSAGLATAMKVDKVSSEIHTVEDQIKTMESGLAAAPDKASDAANRLSRSLEIARAHLTELQQQASDGILGRNALQQAEQANRMIAAKATGPASDVLKSELPGLQNAASTAAPGSKEQLDAQLAVAEKMKQIKAAENSEEDRLDEIRVAQAGKNSAAVIAIRENEVARKIAAFGKGSAEELEAEDRLAKAKEAAANRGAAAGAKGAKDELGATESSVEGQISAIERQTEYETKHLEVAVKLKQITEQQKATFTIAALEKEKAAIDALYAQELALGNLSLTKRQEILNKEQAENDKVAEAMYEAQAQAAEKAQKAWDSVTKTINSAIDSQVSGLLKGTENFRTAMKNIAASLIESGIKGGLNSLLTGAEGIGGKALGAAAAGGQGGGLLQATMSALSAALGFNTAATTTHTLATTTGTAVQIGGNAVSATNTAGILANTVSTDANTLATYVGKLIPGFATGTPYVQRTGVALLHEGERIVPANLNTPEGMASMIGAGGGDSSGGEGAGGGDVTHNWGGVHIHAPGVSNGPAIGKWLDENPRAIMKSLSRAISGGHQLGFRNLGAR